jgi:hypothetical protein
MMLMYMNICIHVYIYLYIYMYLYELVPLGDKQNKVLLFLVLISII